MPDSEPRVPCFGRLVAALCVAAIVAALACFFFVFPWMIGRAGV